MGSNPIPSAILRRKFPQFINVLCGSLLACPAPFLSNALSAGGRHRRPRWVQRSVVRGKRRNSGLAGIRRSPSGRPATKRTRTNGESNRARTFGPRSAWRQLSQRCRPSRRPQARCSPCTAYLAQRKARGSVGINPGSLCGSGDRTPPGRQIAVADVLRVLTPTCTAKPETARRVRQQTKAVIHWAIAPAVAAMEAE